jgi:nitroreductase / dihydropteridine reductase
MKYEYKTRRRDMEFRDVVMQRYATKKFDGKRIPDDKIKELIDLIRFAASAVNLQPWKIKIVTDQDTKEKLRAAAFGQEQVGTCSHLLVFYADTDTDGLINKVEDTMKKSGVPDEMRNMVLGLARNMAGGMTPAAKVAWAQCQVFLALGNAVNGAKSLGFDSCPMTGFDPAQCAAVLGTRPNLVLTALCPVGYAIDTPMPKMRFSQEDILL